MATHSNIAVMAGLDPATYRASVRERKSYGRADARQMDGRLKAAHDGYCEDHMTPRPQARSI